MTDRQTDRHTDRAGRRTDRQTDRETDREQWFNRTGVQKLKFGTECDSYWGEKIIAKLNPFIKTMVDRSNIHYSKINQKRNWKKVHIISSGTTKKMRPPWQLIQLCI